MQTESVTLLIGAVALLVGFVANNPRAAAALRIALGILTTFKGYRQAVEDGTITPAEEQSLGHDLAAFFREAETDMQTIENGWLARILTRPT